MTVTELSALAGALTAVLGLLTYIARMAYSGFKALDGHLTAMRDNTLATKSLNQRMDRLEAIVTGGTWRNGNSPVKP